MDTNTPVAQTPAERELAELIVESLNIDWVKPEAIDPDGALFGGDLGLDSIDALAPRPSPQAGSTGVLPPVNSVRAWRRRLRSSARKRGRCSRPPIA